MGGRRRSRRRGGSRPSLPSPCAWTMTASRRSSRTMRRAGPRTRSRSDWSSSPPLASGSLRARFARLRGRTPWVLPLGLALILAACATPPAGAPPPTAFERDARFAALVPDAADRTVVEAAHAALLSRPEEATRAVRRLEAIDTVLEAADEPPTGLVPAATDLANATLDDRTAHRSATENLLERSDLDPALRARLEITEHDDPLVLARDRLHEDWLLEFGRAFNAMAEPLGSSITTFTLAPYRLARSVVNYALALHEREPLPLRQRQALAHWKTFLAQHPDAPEAGELAPRVEAAEGRWQRTLRNRDLRAAKQALAEERYSLALVQADRALRRMPEDPEATQVRDAAAMGLLGERELQRSSLQTAPDLDPAQDAAAQRAIAVALLRSRNDAAPPVEAVDSEGPLSDEARFAQAISLGERGQEDAMWSELDELASEDPESSNMARHAAALVASPEANPHRAFEDARLTDGVAHARWVALGPFAGGPRKRNLPRPIEWLVDLPSMAQSLMSLPVRLVQLPWAPSLGT